MKVTARDLLAAAEAASIREIRPTDDLDLLAKEACEYHKFANPQKVAAILETLFAEFEIVPLTFSEVLEIAKQNSGLGE